MVYLELGLNGEKRTALFAGNFGRVGMPLLPDIVQVPGADVVVTEATYGNRQHVVRDDLEVLAVILKDGLERANKPGPGGAGVIVIPVFTIGRTQVILDRIRRLRQPAFCLSR